MAYSSNLPNSSYGGQSVFNPLPNQFSFNPGSSYQGSPTAGSPIPGGSYTPNNPGSSYAGQPTQGSPMPSSGGDVLGASTGGGGGGGGTRNLTEQEAIGLGLDWNNLPGGYSRNVPQGPSEEEIMAAINSAYDASSGYLNQAEQNLRSDFPTITSEIKKQSEANQAQLGANKQKAIGGVDKNVSSAKGRKEDALAQARRLYSELQRANTQRFGGASSAGQAVSELQGAEAQRQFGATGRDFGKFMQEAEAQKAQIETDFNASLLNLKTQADSAVNQANRDFQSKLLEINRLRAETESNKAAKRLEALMNLKNQVFSINQQNQQFEQQLQAMKYQQMLQLDTYQKQLGAQQSPSYDQRSIGTNLSIGNQNMNTGATPQYTGAISTYSPGKKDDFYSGMY